MHFVDWLIIACYFLMTLVVGLYFTKKAGKDIDSFFVSNRSLPWYLSGVSLIATSFASDTPLWMTDLVRTYGVHYVWQYWAPALGGTMAVVLFARLWRRVGVLTDIELLEVRYSGKWAAALRFWTAFATALFFCPLIIGWVSKAMETITREAMGLPEEFRAWTTALVIAVALVSCMLSGLWGVVYTDFAQFLLAIFGTTVLAVISVQQVGGLEAMIDKLQTLEDWGGANLSLLPQVGSGPGEMSYWNFIGYFGILWIHVAQSGGFQSQRLLACRNPRDASFAMLTLSVLYYAVICWPWIIVALCSLILIPDLGAGVEQAVAYPRMVVTLLPAGLRGLLLVALLAAFMSTISTMLNWGASYIVNDLYKRFLVPDKTAHHYVTVGRWTTFLMAVVGGVISYLGDSILQLVFIAFVLWGGFAVIGVMRWFWPRMNALGELAASVAAYTLAALMVVGGVFDDWGRRVMGFETDLSSDPNLLGARMLFMVVVMVALAIGFTYLAPRTRDEKLKEFLLRARPFHYFWKPTMQRLGIEYEEGEHIGRTIVSWILILVSVYGLLFGVGQALLGRPWIGLGCVVVFLVSLWISVKRIEKDCPV
ncbi:MAG: Na+:solute symporter [Candidatus Omnitrophica bacterium]|nr:Na+:solute symporter [Candidatus Omnitrophota bacterium]